MRASLFAPLALGASLALPVAPLRAQDAAPPWRPELLGLQFTAIPQWMPPLHSLYAGPNSLRGRGDAAMTHTYGLYGGMALTRTLAAYLDVEAAPGSGISDALGLAGLTDGDVIRQGAATLTKGPVIARAFLRWALPLSGERSAAERGMDQLPGAVPDSRLEVVAGKVAATDFFDLNRYANSTRTQFMNWGLINNTAWDFAADTRGYSIGVAAAWMTPHVALRAGSFQMPVVANGPELDGDVGRARGDNVELTVAPGSAGTVLRFLAYLNHGRMGNYEEALAIGRATRTLPDIAADDRPGRFKYGFGFNLEQPLADSGETGVFLRAGWDDGHTESFVFTEVDTHLSAGAQLAGAAWGRPEDRLGIAVVVHGLSQPHANYLAAGGLGFLLGDGALRYDNEEILEAYYRLQVGRYVEVSPDVQLIRNPGYNADRGPASVFSLRVNARY
jgi:hypothetical protein